VERGRFGITRRRVLTVLLFILLIAPIPMMDIEQMTDPHAPPSSGTNWTWLLIVFVLMGSALRGNRSALGSWAVLSGLIGTALVVWGYSVDNGAVRFLGGFVGIALAIVFALLRDELAEPTEIREEGSSRQNARLT
jgi:hypothetical protein